MTIPFKDHIYYGVVTFPIGGQQFHLANDKSFRLTPGSGPKVEAEDGSVWEYRGISAYPVDNRERVNGWKRT